MLYLVEPDKSCGSDGFCTLFLKECICSTAKPKPRSSDVVVVQENLLDNWRIIRVRLVPKLVRCSTLLPPLFGSVMIIPTFLRMWEKIILKCLKPLFSSSSGRFQFAYKSQRSTPNSLASLDHCILPSLDGRLILIKRSFLDFSNALHTTDRKVLFFEF